MPCSDKALKWGVVNNPCHKKCNYNNERDRGLTILHNCVKSFVNNFDGFNVHIGFVYYTGC